MNASNHITIEQNAEVLKRYAFFERAAMRTLAGWLPGVPEWEAKNEFGMHISDTADAVEVLYGRLRELRTHQPERNLGDALPQIAAALDAAQNTAEVIAAVYLVVKRGLLEAFRAHPAATWSEFDKPTLKAIDGLLSNLERQVAWAETFLPTIEARYPGWQGWHDHVTGLIAADGGITGMGAKTPLAPHPADRTRLLPWKQCQRVTTWPIFDPADDAQPDREQDPAGYRMWRFKHYVNEMTAAETLGSILWLTPEMPWEFQHNVARHLWDEIRHSQLGQLRVRQLGCRVEDVPQVVQIYNVMMTLPAVDQYALLTTVIEPNGMPEKTTNREHWETLEDDISAAAVSYDWSDENFHVRWGKKWTPVLLQTYRCAETPEQIRDRMEAWLVENTPVKMQQNHAAHQY